MATPVSQYHTRLQLLVSNLGPVLEQDATLEQVDPSPSQSLVKEDLFPLLIFLLWRLPCLLINFKPPDYEDFLSIK